MLAGTTRLGGYEILRLGIDLLRDGEKTTANPGVAGVSEVDFFVQIGFQCLNSNQ